MLPAWFGFESDDHHHERVPTHTRASDHIFNSTCCDLLVSSRESPHILGGPWDL